jgi:hypothetical protein
VAVFSRHANKYYAVWWPLAVFFLVAAAFREFSIYSTTPSLPNQSFLSARRSLLEAIQRRRRHPAIAILLVRFSYSCPRAHSQNFNRYSLVGIAIMFAGVIYWATWRILLPKVFGYELIPGKETLADGTVVMLVSSDLGVLVSYS